MLLRVRRQTLAIPTVSFSSGLCKSSYLLPLRRSFPPLWDMSGSSCLKKSEPTLESENLHQLAAFLDFWSQMKSSEAPRGFRLHTNTAFPSSASNHPAPGPQRHRTFGGSLWACLNASHSSTRPDGQQQMVEFLHLPPPLNRSESGGIGYKYQKNSWRN